MSTHVARTRILLAKSRTSRSYSSTAPSTNTNHIQQPKTTTRSSRRPTIPRKPRIKDLSNDMPPRSFLLDLPTKPTSKRLTPAQREHQPLSAFEKKIEHNPYGMPHVLMFWRGGHDPRQPRPFISLKTSPLRPNMYLFPLMSTIAAILATPVRQCLYTRLLLPSGTGSGTRISAFFFIIRG
jgi:hypothetical protein